MIEHRTFVKINAGRFRPDPKPEPKEKKKPKPISKVKKPTGEAEVFRMIWNERPHVSQVSGKPIKEARPGNFAHVLPKAQNKYPRFKLLKQNIILLTQEEHDQWDKGIRAELRMDPNWAFMFELEAQLKEKYKEG